MNFNLIDKEIGGGEPLWSQKMGNQHFAINKAFRYDIWGEQTSTVASEIH